MKHIVLLVMLVFFFSCNTNRDTAVEQWKNELIKTEEDFARMAQEEGISKAFLAFAADDAVLLRNNRLISGKDSIRESYNNSNADKGKLSWKPDFVDVALSGDLGYTYGKYTYTSIDSTGSEHVVEGIFHTVWKRQADGTWKFVWD